MLTIQYRMNELISLASSEHFYRSQLFAHPSNQKLVLSTSEYMQKTTMTQPSFIDANCPIVWIDHICPEQSDDAQKKGTKNPEEVNIVLKVLEELLFKFRIPIDKIGVITPYNAQRALFFQMLKNVTGGSTPISKFLEVSTIDSYQGREKDVIIMMATKSGGSSVGFLTEERRMNVSMTRARRLFIFVGNSNTLVYDRSRMPFTRLFFDKVVAHGQLFKFSSIDRRLTRNGPPLNGNPATSNYVYKGDAGPTMFPNLKYTLETTTTVPDYTRNHEASWKINMSRVVLPAKENNRHENRAAHGYDENSFLTQLLQMPNRDTPYPNAEMDVLNVINGFTPSNR